MLNTKIHLLILSILTLIILTSSCKDEVVDVANPVQSPDPIVDDQPDLITSPWQVSFSDYLVGNEFQVDNDGNGAHNWDAEEYEDEPIDVNNGGVDIRKYLWASGDSIELLCPDGDGSRRTEFRERQDRTLLHSNFMEFECRFFNVGDEKLIFAQLHNDWNSEYDVKEVNRPYLTAFIEDGQLHIERTNDPDGSKSSRYNETLEFSADDLYQIRFSSLEQNTDITATVINLTTGDKIENTWPCPVEWLPYDGQFYYKFGAYMPKGGSNETRTRVETLALSGY